MRLLEIIPTPETDRAAMDTVARFADLHLGKGVVFAKDTPNFIGNRIGTFSVLNLMRLMQEMDLSVEEVDAIDRAGRGLAALGNVSDDRSGGARHCRAGGREHGGDSAAGGAPASLALPDFVHQMLERQLAGGQKRRRVLQEGARRRRPEDERLALDWKTLEYRPRQKPRFPALEMAKNVDDLGRAGAHAARLRGDWPQKGDKAGQFLWSALSDLWTYSADRIPEISDSRGRNRSRDAPGVQLGAGAV